MAAARRAAATPAPPDCVWRRRNTARAFSLCRETESRWACWSATSAASSPVASATRLARTPKALRASERESVVIYEGSWPWERESSIIYEGSRHWEREPRVIYERSWPWERASSVNYEGSWPWERESRVICEGSRPCEREPSVIYEGLWL